MTDQLPHDLEAESSLLGAMIISKDALEKGIDLVEKSDFYVIGHQRIFDAMRDEAINGSGILDAVTLADHLRTKGQLEGVGGAMYLSLLMDVAYNLVTIEAHAEILRSHTKRRAILKAVEAAKFAIHSNADPSEVQSELLTAISDMTSKTKVQGGSLPDLMREEAVKVLGLNAGEMMGESTGIDTIDDYLQGLKDGSMYVIAARPRIGKSTLVDQIATHVGVDGLVFILITEMSPRQRASRHLSSMTGVPLPKLNMGLLSSSQRHMVEDIAQSVKVAPKGVFIESAAGLTANEVRMAVKKLKARHGRPSLVVLDYIQQLKDESPRGTMSERTGEKSLALKDLAIELDCPVIVCSQLNRECDKEKRPPRISDLRASGDIEQDAYAIAFLHRPDPEDPTRVMFLLEKHKNGPEGRVPLKFRPEVFKFEGSRR